MRIAREGCHRLPAGLLVGALLVPVLACEAEDPVTLLNEGRDILNFAVVPGTGPLPSGSFKILGWSIVSRPAGEVDVFGRQGDALPYWLPGWGYFSMGQIMGTAANDTRLPALRADEAGASFREDDGFFFANILGPEYWIPNFGLPLYDFWFEMSGFKPDTRYWAGLVRYGLKVNGAPDQEEVLLGAQVLPDELVVLGGSPGGSADRQVFFSGGNIFLAEAGANPLIFGYANSNPSGGLVFDQLFWAFDAGGTPVWYDSEDPVPEMSPVAPNDFRSFDLPRYNYFVIWAEDPVANPDAQPVARFQFGLDLDLEGNPIPDTYGPFPKGPLTTEQLEAVKAVLVPGRVSATFENLEAADYTLALVNRNTGAETVATADLVITDPDGNETELLASSFPGGEGFRIAASVSDLTVGEPVGAFTDLVLRVGGATPLWFNYADQKGTPDDPADDVFNTSGDLQFGEFDPQGGRIYRIAGSGEGAFYLDSLVVQVRRVPAPPAGYFYQGWVMHSKEGRLSPTNRLTLNEVGDGFDRVSAAAVGGSFGSYDMYFVTLEPEAGDPATPAPTKVQVSEEGSFEAARTGS